jgi:hypothetical protein
MVTADDAEAWFTACGYIKNKSSDALTKKILIQIKVGGM